MIDLPVIFTVLMGVAILAYVVLDGYDLGVGMLMPAADRDEQNRMVASIGPFWDANETWLVLGVGLLLVAFPVAHGEILGALYLPVAAMLVGLMLRGVAFELRIKAEGWHKELWNWLFWAGSTLASLSQGFMLGRYITGFAPGLGYWLFALVVAGGLCGGYVLLGATWLVLRTDGPLQAKAIAWARWGLLWVALGVALVSLGTPLVSETVRDKWFDFPRTLAIDGFAWWQPSPPGLGLDHPRQIGLEAVRRRGRDLRARLHRPRLQPVPLRHHGPPHDLGSGRASERAGLHAGRNSDRAAFHRGLHDLRLPRVPRQSQRRLLRIIRGQGRNSFLRTCKQSPGPDPEFATVVALR